MSQSKSAWKKRIALLVVTATVLLAPLTSPVLAQSNGTNATNTSNTAAGTSLQGLGATAAPSLPSNPDIVIRSSTDFAKLDSGQTAVIPPGTTINMPVSGSGTQIPSNTRVLSRGATLVYDGSPRTGVFDKERMLVLKDNVVLRGVEIVGPVAGRAEPGDPNRFGGRNKRAIMLGIEVPGQGVEISHSTVRGWPAGNIRFIDSGTGRVSYSKIVGAYESDRGYGLSAIDNSNVVATTSYFNRNRHSLEAGGSGSYTVTDSVIGPDSSSHPLDVHPPAGGRYVYRNLTVMADSGLTMRQIPEGGAVVENIWFTQASPEQAIEQIDQVRVNNPSDSRTHRGSKIADAANGFGDFRNMQISGIHFGEGVPPGVGAPASMPGPGQIPGAPVGTGGGAWFGTAILAALAQTAATLLGTVAALLAFAMLLFVIVALVGYIAVSKLQSAFWLAVENDITNERPD